MRRGTIRAWIHRCPGVVPDYGYQLPGRSPRILRSASLARLPGIRGAENSSGCETANGRVFLIHANESDAGYICTRESVRFGVIRLPRVKRFTATRTLPVPEISGGVSAFRASHQFTNVNCHQSPVAFPNVEPSNVVTLQRQGPLLPKSKVQDEFGSPFTVMSGNGCHSDPARMSLSTT